MKIAPPFKIVGASLSAVVAGLAVFLLFLLATGLGPGYPRLPRRTTAQVLQIHGEAPGPRYIVTVLWTNDAGVAHEQEDAWAKAAQPDLREGAIIPAISFHATADWKLKLSPDRIGAGSLGDYWLRQGLWDWGLFWGPILLVVPSTWLAYVLLRQPKTAPVVDGAPVQDLAFISAIRELKFGPWDFFGIWDFYGPWFLMFGSSASV
jgi:hypothetical protein